MTYAVKVLIVVALFVSTIFDVSKKPRKAIPMNDSPHMNLLKIGKLKHNEVSF